MTKCPICENEIEFKNFGNISKRGLFHEFDCPKCNTRLTDRKLRIAMYYFLLMVNVVTVIVFIGVTGVFKEDIFGIPTIYLLFSAGAIAMLVTLNARRSLRLNTHYQEVKHSRPL